MATEVYNMVKLAIFLHGTIIMHKNGLEKNRKSRVQQIIEGNDPSIHEFESYVPIGATVKKLSIWYKQGTQIIYLSSHKNLFDVEKDARVLKKFHFPLGEIMYRKNTENYTMIVEKLLPDIIIEDDCESIGGEKAMVYPNLGPRLQSKIKSIVVQEFRGIEHLPDDLNAL